MGAALGPHTSCKACSRWQTVWGSEGSASGLNGWLGSSFIPCPAAEGATCPSLSSESSDVRSSVCSEATRGIPRPCRGCMGCWHREPCPGERNLWSSGPAACHGAPPSGCCCQEQMSKALRITVCDSDWGMGGCCQPNVGAWSFAFVFLWEHVWEWKLSSILHTHPEIKLGLF